MNKFYILVLEKSIGIFDVQISKSIKNIKQPKSNEYYITKSDIITIETKENEEKVLLSVKCWLKRYNSRPLTIECTNEIYEYIKLFS